MTGPQDRPADTDSDSASPDPRITYAKAKELARHADAKVRRALAERDDIQPEILFFLAEDPDPAVRKAIAHNNATPRHADLLLAKDQDEAVRCSLADKLGTLFPNLSEKEKNQVYRLSTQALQVLARDQIVRVRAILADTLKHVANAPPDVVLRLAQDAEILVAGPILEHSPILTDEDLIELVTSSTAVGATAAIARRSTVSESVSDAVVASDDREAITTLLANQSAQIREDTLDHLIDRAHSVTDWHLPMVRRPKLSPHGITRLAQFVADSLLGELRNRADLDEATADAVAAVIHTRLHAEPEPADEDKGATESSRAVQRRRALDMLKARKLDEAAMMSEIAAGNRHFVHAALAELASVPEAMVQQALSGSNAKTIAALGWEAKFSMQVTEQLQLRFGDLQPEQILRAKESDGSYPLSEDAMQWQIDLLRGSSD